MDKTRLTYNCAHLRLTKESLTIWVKFFGVKIFLGENLIFWAKILGWKFFGVKIFLVENFWGENFWGEIILGEIFLG